MAMTDTAEYWHDVKAHRPQNDFYHAKGLDCNHRHHVETEYLADVTCHACLRILKDDPNRVEMKDGNAPKYYYLTKAGAKRARKHDAFVEKHGKCSCGCNWVVRTNKSNGAEFLGCSNYPKCKGTKSINA